MIQEDREYVERINSENEKTVFPDKCKRRLCQIINKLDAEVERLPQQEIRRGSKSSQLTPIIGVMGGFCLFSYSVCSLLHAPHPVPIVGAVVGAIVGVYFGVRGTK